MIVKGCAGLGNRLISAFDAANYAARNSRKLIVDWADGQFDEKQVNAFEKCFQLKDRSLHDIDKIENWQGKTHSSSLFKANKHAGVYDLFAEAHSGFYSRLPMRLFPKGIPRKLRRRWQPVKDDSFATSLNFGSDLKDGLLEDIVYYVDFLPQVDYTALPLVIELKPAIRQKINDFAQANNLGAFTGIHIRYTDKKPTKDVRSVIDYLKIKNTEKIFLATDSAEIERLFLEDFDNVLMFPKLKPELKKEGLHQWALYNNAEDLKYRIYEESVIEMFLLSACKTLLYQGNSSFSNVSRVYHTDRNNCFDWQKIQS